MKATFNLLFADGPDLPIAKAGKTLLAAKVPVVVERKALLFMDLLTREVWPRVGIDVGHGMFDRSLAHPEADEAIGIRQRKGHLDAVRGSAGSDGHGTGGVRRDRNRRPTG